MIHFNFLSCFVLVCLSFPLHIRSSESFDEYDYSTINDSGNMPSTDADNNTQSILHLKEDLIWPNSSNHSVREIHFNNGSHESNLSDASGTECAYNSLLPVKGIGEEVNHSLKILLMLFVVAVCFLEIHLLMLHNFNYLPESSIVVFTGAVFGAFFEAISGHLPGDFAKKEAFDPTVFFLFLLPPIMYESAYNLHKGNFFRNIGSILIFAIIGTTVSALIIGGSLYYLGQKKFVYELSFTESFAFGSFLSAVDPVATLAIFQALEVEPVLNMLVIGESILNDAVAIVLSSAVWESGKEENQDLPISFTIIQCTLRFTSIFFSSAAVGVAFALFAALLFKHVALRLHSSLEFGMMLIFIYAPYCLAQVLQLSGIIAILFNGIVMSHYTHFNLSPLVQQIMQVTLRSMAFIAETCVFAYLGVSIFSFQITIDFPFVLASIILCLIARAFNVFPLSLLVNIFRENKITPKMMFIMWFSAIRGAVAYALALRFEFEERKRSMVITSTLIIVLFTTLVFGGGTMPLVKCLQRREKKKLEILQSEVCLIKTEKLGGPIDADRPSDDEEEGGLITQNAFVRLDAKYLLPFFTRPLNSRLGSEKGSKISDDFSRDWQRTVRSNSAGISP